MPDLAEYRRELPDLSDEELEAVRWSLRGLAREIVDTYDAREGPDVECPTR
jgi:hypothetical protein